MIVIMVLIAITEAVVIVIRNSNNNKTLELQPFRVSGFGPQIRASGSINGNKRQETIGDYLVRTRDPPPSFEAMPRPGKRARRLGE